MSSPVGFYSPEQPLFTSGLLIFSGSVTFERGGFNCSSMNLRPFLGRISLQAHLPSLRDFQQSRGYSMGKRRQERSFSLFHSLFPWIPHTMSPDGLALRDR